MKLRIEKGEEKIYWYCSYCGYKHYFLLDSDDGEWGTYVDEREFCDNELKIRWFDVTGGDEDE